VTRGWTLPRTAALLGLDPWPWQLRVARMGLSRRAGRWRYPIVVVVVPRQSGKTRLTMLVALDRCLTKAGAQVWYTAQSRADALLRWREVVRWLRSTQLVEGRSRFGVLDTGWDYRLRQAIGNEEIEFSNGAQLRIFAPAEDSLHGSVTDLVVLDEARFFDARHGDGLMGAVLPTQATRDGQVWIPSTAGDPGSLFLARQVEAARASLGSKDARVAIADWGISPDVCDGDLLEAVWANHPAAGLSGGPVLDALKVAGEQMPAWQFAHEYGNRWRTAAEARVIPASAWAACESVAVLPEGRLIFAADIAPDRSEATVVAAVATGPAAASSAGDPPVAGAGPPLELAPIGRPALEVVDHRPGAGWVAERLVELAAEWDAAAVVIDAAGPAGTVADQLRPIYDRLVVTSTRDLQAACAGFYDAALAGALTHRPSVVLDGAVGMATKRTVGQSWVWSRVDGGTPLVAASLAWWAAARLEPTDVEQPAIF
jgi:hypothetical protein